MTSEQLFSAGGGSLVSLAQATGAGVSIFGAGSSTTDAHSRAVMTAGVLDLGAFAIDQFTGASDANTVKGGMALALWDKPFTAPSGATFVRVTYNFDGDQTISGRGQTEAGVVFQKNGGSSLFGFRVSNSDGTGPTVFYNGSYILGGPGITISPLQVTVNSTLIYDVPVASGEVFDLSMIAYAASIASASTGLLSPSLITSDFYSTASVSSIQAFGASGPLAGGTLFSASAVPEPSTFGFAIGGAVLFFLRRRGFAALRASRPR